MDTELIFCWSCPRAIIPIFSFPAVLHWVALRNVQGSPHVVSLPDLTWIILRHNFLAVLFIRTWELFTKYLLYKRSHYFPTLSYNCWSYNIVVVIDLLLGNIFFSYLFSPPLTPEGTYLRAKSYCLCTVSWTAADVLLLLLIN